MTKQDVYTHYVAEATRLGLDAQEIADLHRIAKALHGLAEAHCNYGLTERQERRWARLENEAKAICAKYDMPLYIQGDPRGWPLHLNSTDSWGGVGVPPF